MADTEHVPKRGLREDEDKNEYFDNSGTVKENVKKVADAISENRGRVVVFTGAGISTSSGIPDYRGPNGVWTLRERGEEPKFDVTLESARPTDGHRVVASLVEEGFVNGLVTTNIDNLHQRGGVPKELVAELHGNCFKEVCGACAKVYWREFDVMTKGSQDHKTHRTCDACNGDLLDTIVHFNESLSQDDFSKAENWAKSAAVALVVGTSLRVKPANTLPTLAEKVFIINLQKTPLDNTSIVTYEKHCKSDLFLNLLAEALGLPHGEIESEWETTYDKLSADNKLKQKQFSQRMLANLVTPQLKQFRPQEKNEIADLKNEESKEVGLPHPIPLLIRNCCDCSFRLTSNVVKLVLLECSNVSVIVEARVLTGVLEIINCQNVSVAVVKALPTVQIDKSKDVIIGFVAPSLSGSIVSSANSSVSIAPRKDLPPELIVCAAPVENTDYALSMTQFMTRIQEDCSLLSEVVVREGNGYATTKREKEAADAKDAKTEAALIKFLSTMIK